MKLQMMASVTAGARGLLYWVIGAGDDHAGWATTPRLGRHWAQARRLNSIVVGLGPTLMQLSSDAVVRIAANATLASATGSAADVVAQVQETLGCSVNTPNDIVNENGADADNNPACAGGYRYVRCPGVRNAMGTSLPVMSATFGFSEPRGWCLGDTLTENECVLLCDGMRVPNPATPSLCMSVDWDASSGRCCVNPPGACIRRIIFRVGLSLSPFFLFSFFLSLSLSLFLSFFLSLYLSFFLSFFFFLILCVLPFHMKPSNPTPDFACDTDSHGAPIHLTSAGAIRTVHIVKMATTEQWACPALPLPSSCVVNNTASACAGYNGPIGHVVVGHDFVLSTSTHDDGE